jgi:hypothetical protein
MLSGHIIPQGAAQFQFFLPIYGRLWYNKNGMFLSGSLTVE